MIMVVAIALVLGLEALVLRRRLAKLAGVRIRRLWLVWIALADQLLVISILPGSAHAALDVANVASYAVGGAFLWANRHIAGTWLVGVGAGLNVLALASNGGIMPASRAALAASGWHAAAGHFQNSAYVAHAKLAFLGDIFAIPKWMPGHDVFSIGDLLIVAGVGFVVWRNSARPARERPTSAASGPASAGALPPS